MLTLLTLSAAFAADPSPPPLAVVNNAGSLLGTPTISASGDVTLRDAGPKPVAIASITLEQTGALFSVDGDLGPGVLSGDATRKLTVHFKPTAEGPATAHLVIHTDAGDQTVDLHASSDTAAFNAKMNALVGAKGIQLGTKK
jgi:hypothetical protein